MAWALSGSTMNGLPGCGAAKCAQNWSIATCACWLLGARRFFGADAAVVAGVGTAAMLGFGGSGVPGRDGSCLGDGGRLEGGRALGRTGSSICRRFSIIGYGMLMVIEEFGFATMDQRHY